jgi:hypothetical protein
MMPQHVLALAGRTVATLALLALVPNPVFGQVKASIPSGITPVWTKGIQPISRESYWNAVECGKQKTPRPACVFYDADLCKNEHFTLAMYTPYKQVAYEVWSAVSQKKEPPTPSYGSAQRTRVVLGVKSTHPSQNPLTAVAVKRGGKAATPVSKTLDSGAANYIYDFDVFAPTAAVTIEFVGKASTVTCSISPAMLARMR